MTNALFQYIIIYKGGIILIYNFEIDDNTINKANQILEEEGMSIDYAINILLRKIIKEGTIGFLFSHSKSVSNYEDSQVIKTNISPTTSMTKSIAKRMFIMNGYQVSNNLNFASENKATRNYWMNPSIDVLEEDWDFILHDKTNRTLHLFKVPKNSLYKDVLFVRPDIPNLIDIHIAYNDPTFSDNRSEISFKPFYQGTIEY